MKEEILTMRLPVGLPCQQWGATESSREREAQLCVTLRKSLSLSRPKLPVGSGIDLGEVLGAT